MRVSSFSLLIPEGFERDSGHVELAHGSVYVIRLGNHGSRRCDATVSIDGKEVGCFRINGNDTVTLERSAHDSGKFTFFKSDSTEAAQSNVGGVENDMRGLVSVMFRPERHREVQRSRMVGRGGPCGQSVNGGDESSWNSVGGTTERFFTNEEKTSGGIKNLQSGITGLTGHSNQSFYTVQNLDYCPDGMVTITLRLVAGSAVRELTPVRGNPIPSAVE